jgi:hypothetical protein
MNFHTFRDRDGREHAVAPQDCSSAFCGQTSEACPTCPHNATREEFLAWVDEHDAKVEDWIWSPSVWTAQR